jgi:hypothetical protein
MVRGIVFAVAAVEPHEHRIIIGPLASAAYDEEYWRQRRAALVQVRGESIIKSHKQ